MFCPKCGAQLPDVAKFCNKCGADLRMLSDPPPRRESSYQYADYGYSTSAAAKKPRAARKKKKISNLTAGILAVVLVVGIFVAVLVPSTINYNKKAKLKTANSMAKVAAVSLSDLLTDAMYSGMSAYDIMYGYSSGDGTYSGGGAIVDVKESYAVKTDVTYNVSDPESIEEGGARKIAEALAENGSEAGYFTVMDIYTADKELIVLQWKADKDGEVIGQCALESDDGYYRLTNTDAVQWDSYKEKHPRWGKYYKN